MTGTVVVTDMRSDGGGGRYLGYLFALLARRGVAARLVSFAASADWAGLGVPLTRLDLGVPDDRLIAAAQHDLPGFPALLDGADFAVFVDSCCIANLGPRRQAACAGVPSLIVEHSCDPALAATMSAENRAALAQIYAEARAVVTVSEAHRDAARSAFGCPADKLRRVYNPVLDGFFAPRDSAVRAAVRAEFGIDAAERLVLSIGHVVAYKGIGVYFDFLVACAEELRARRWRFVWAGDGELLGAVRAAARRHGVADLVTFPGWRGDVERLLDAADALFHPALTEAFGLGVAEAMARGVPVAAFAVGGVPEVLGGAGILVRPDAGAEDTRSGFLSALATLLADPETYAARGRARAGENFGFARFEAEMGAILGAMERR